MKRQFIQKPDKKKQKSRLAGISLIEVLIAVSVILLLLVALFRNLGGDVNKGRDAQRKKDLKTIKVAMEDYYNDYDCYPPAGAFDVCGSDNLNPYLKQIPCDPLGQPYLYLPEAGNGGVSCGGYRVLTRMNNDHDPSIEQVGCPFGCGVPDGVANPEEYNYGIAEGVALNQNLDATPTPTFSPNEEPSGTPTPTGPIVPEESCTVDHPCYCCDGGGGNACNVWYNGIVGSDCNLGPYSAVGDCQSYTVCQ